MNINIPQQRDVGIKIDKSIIIKGSGVQFSVENGDTLVIAGMTVENNDTLVIN